MSKGVCIEQILDTEQDCGCKVEQPLSETSEEAWGTH